MVVSCSNCSSPQFSSENFLLRDIFRHQKQQTGLSDTFLKILQPGFRPRLVDRILISPPVLPSNGNL